MRPNKSLKSLLIFIALLILTSGFAQDKEVISFEFNNEPLRDVLSEIESKHNIQFYFIQEWLNDIRVNGNFNDISIESLLGKILNGTTLGVIRYDDHSYVLVNKIQDGQIIQSYSSNGELLKRYVIGEENEQVSNALIKGRVTDLESGEPITGATIVSKTLKIGAAADNYGYFEVRLPVGEHELFINSVGYHEEKMHVILRSDGAMDISLVSSTNTLDEITIIGLAEKEQVSEAQMSMNVIEMKDVEYVPSLLGERDIVKTIALLPGVVSGEATNGYSVRGSNLGQNLIFVDGAPVYNASHLFGLFSIFNPGVVKSTTIYKGTMPAQYGGRVASVMNVDLKEGTSDRVIGEAGIGLISSRLHLEGPISNKVGFVVGGRASYINRYLERIENADVRNSSGRFYDVNAKFSFNPNEANSFGINSLLSFDDFTLPNQDNISYGTRLLSGKWSRKISPTAINNVTLAYSNYSSNIQTRDSINNESIDNSITTFLVKSSLTLFNFDDHSINVGLEGNFTIIDPGKSTESQLQQIITNQIEKERGLETSFFASDEFDLTNRLTLNYGLRYSIFTLIGPKTEYKYASGTVRKEGNVIDSTTYSNNEIVKNYSGLEPRLFVKYQLNPGLDIKFNAGRAYQYTHLISNTASISPLSIYKLSDTHIKPQVADQASFGVFKKLDNKPIEISTEVFYRRIKNLPDYKNGANLINNPNLEREIISGTGKAYGVEVQLVKNTGKLSGLISYSYTRSLSKMDNELKEERINNGQYYSSDYDIPHTLSLSGDYMLSRAWSLTFNWMYNSGRPTSYPEAVYYDKGIPVLYFNNRNEYRIPDYHRMDLSLNWKTPNLKLDKKWDLSWSFSLYNVYGRSNAYSVFFERNGTITQAKKLSILAQPIPSITLTIKFL